MENYFFMHVAKRPVQCFAAKHIDQSKIAVLKGYPNYIEIKFL